MAKESNLPEGLDRLRRAEADYHNRVTLAMAGVKNGWWRLFVRLNDGVPDDVQIQVQDEIPPDDPKPVVDPPD